MAVFIANFGIANALWPRCRDSSVALSYDDDDPTWPLWLADDRAGYISFTMAHKLTARGISVPKPVASRWFNLLSEVRDSAGDLWIHREKDELWWTTTTDEPARIAKIPAAWPEPNTPFIHLVEKPTAPWTNRTRGGTLLLWSALHPKARHFLFTEGTLQRPAPDNAAYARALVAGQDLADWHSQPAWTAIAQRAGHAAVRSFTGWEKAAMRMAVTAERTAKGSTADPVLKVPKLKKFGFKSAQEAAGYVTALLQAQDYVCALSGLPVENDEDVEDREFLASLDRIDSDGHYEPGNLQVVCNFINRWKSDGESEAFRRLLDAVKSVPGRAGDG